MASGLELVGPIAALAAICLVIVVVRQRRRAALLSIENDRWRSLASERADQVAMLSHELRTPLALISGSAEILADEQVGTLTPRQAGLVDNIAVNSLAMIGLTDDILAAAKIDAQMFTMHTEDVNLRSLARRALLDLRGLHPNPLTLECRGYPPSVPGDPQLLRQAVINLVNNAARHGGPGPISIAVRRTEESVLLCVSDEGRGMTPQQRRDLFQRTLRGKSETGNGLGLVITQRIITLHGGHLFIDTAAAHGTTVTAALPIGTAKVD